MPENFSVRRRNPVEKRSFPRSVSPFFTQNTNKLLRGFNFGSNLGLRRAPSTENST